MLRENENYKYLRTLKLDRIKKNQEGVFQKNKKSIGIQTLVNEFKQINKHPNNFAWKIFRILPKQDNKAAQKPERQNKQKLVLHEALHLKDDINKLYVKEKGEEKLFATIEECVDAETRGLEE